MKNIKLGRQKSAAKVISMISKGQKAVVTRLPLSEAEALEFILEPDKKTATSEDARKIAEMICAIAKVLCPLVSKE